MPKDFDVIAEGKVAYEYGFYEQADAEKFAEREARRRPGVAYKVVKSISTFVFWPPRGGPYENKNSEPAPNRGLRVIKGDR